MMDPYNEDMKELVEIFCDESDGLIKELNEILDQYEEEFNPIHLEKFGQIIDRMMGAAQSLGAMEIGKFCEMGKMIGYKASQAKDKQLLELASPILLDAVEMVTSMLAQLRKGERTTKENLPIDAFSSRLKWYLEKFSDIERASVAVKK
jgi:chemotaxis protein histidine kinase CheA